ncbi:MAG: 1-deoxy-D-xylulose-5-phosphate synthase [Lachnospiraceae bacterium]|nr:1-deoxy-D-xylulose-5-phosphate synthase [Lachnospiraceae bacterium]
MALIEKIQHPNDIKKIPPEQYGRLAEEIRQFLLEKVSVTGGHLASNLGAVELTMALHLALNFPEDKIVWDVGHQSYTHKILTGRRDGFDHLRQLGGISGFPKRKESDCDAFDTGHSSTSVSAALGMVRARELRGGSQTIVAVIGDGAMTGGLAYEALNNVSRLSSNLIIILNDNNMSISSNVGGLPKYLSEIRTSTGYLQLRDRIYDSLNDTLPAVVKGISKAKQSLKSLMVPGMFFEDMGITYLGPINGHNVQDMVKAIRDAKRVNKPVLIHVCTKKGAGYGPAEKNPSRFHGTPPFNVATGLPLKPSKKTTYTDVFSSSMLHLAETFPTLVGITAAMEDGVGLQRFHTRYPNRFFDVGIAEQHAVTFAAGLAIGGMKPVVAVYSTFLQRAYDQIVCDVCLQKLPVVFAIDRAGLVGADGETHQGIFDLSYLSSIPGMTVMAPKNRRELSDMLRFALNLECPVAIRYPRGAAYDGLRSCRAPLEMGRAEIICEEGGVLLLAVGSMVKTAEVVKEKLASHGIKSSIANARFVVPMDTELLRKAADKYSLVVTMEENIRSGGFGEHVAAWYAEAGLEIPLLNISIADAFVEHGSPEELCRLTGIDADSVTDKILKKMGDK